MAKESQHQFKATVIIAGTDYGVFNMAAGGAKSSDSNVVFPGNMGAGEALVGPAQYDEMTLRRTIKHNVDSGLEARLDQAHGSPMQVQLQLLDTVGQAGFHRPRGYSGLLTGIEFSDYDASGNDPYTVTLTFKPEAMT